MKANQAATTSLTTPIVFYFGVFVWMALVWLQMPKDGAS